MAQQMDDLLHGKITKALHKKCKSTRTHTWTRTTMTMRSESTTNACIHFKFRMKWNLLEGIFVQFSVNNICQSE